jgi:tRNA(Leu) C34 or U34 (ribose-2'-O)-methylase TrmL
MGVSVFGFWEAGYSYPLLEAEHWRYPLREFGVPKWFMSPVSGINVPELTEVQDDLAALQEEALTKRIVFVDEGGTQSLLTYEHPENACYVFGRSSFSPLRSYADVLEHDSVVIPAGAGLGLLWAHQAAVMVLFDREVKRGGYGH